MALTSKYQFSYYTSHDPNAVKALQERTPTLKMTCLTQKIGRLIEFHRLSIPNSPRTAASTIIRDFLFFNAGHLPLDAAYIPCFFDIYRSDDLFQTVIVITKPMCARQSVPRCKHYIRRSH
jgi:hypothetical protein